MLFHVTATHTPGDCPGFNRANMPEVVKAMDNLENVAKEAGVKIHFFVSAGPAHVSYALLEADSSAALAPVLMSVSIRQDFDIKAVVPEEELAAMAKQLMAQG